MEEATNISDRSDKMREEERREVEEKVKWIFKSFFSTFPQVARYAKSVKEGKGRSLSWSWNNKSKN